MAGCSLGRYHGAALVDLRRFTGRVSSNDTCTRSARSRVCRVPSFRILPYGVYITVAYMFSCGDVGKERGDEVLVRVPLRLNDKSAISPVEGEGRI
ncbi:hypothetical protein R3P38DRAFT_1112511 [Favolaschia claudopus]|uniref:Uncharacterized protein n=1 Tax=Favolaschia claudopus TaxID=2862362 RepID=A0AAW0B8V1_9AGAR